MVRARLLVPPLRRPSPRPKKLLPKRRRLLRQVPRTRQRSSTNTSRAWRGSHRRRWSLAPSPLMTAARGAFASPFKRACARKATSAIGSTLKPRPATGQLRLSSGAVLRARTVARGGPHDHDLGPDRKGERIPVRFLASSSPKVLASSGTSASTNMGTSRDKSRPPRPMLVHSSALRLLLLRRWRWRAWSRACSPHQSVHM